MKLELLSDGKVAFSLSHLFENLDGETLRRVIDALACTDAVIDEVTNQILDGWTSMDSHAGKYCTASPAPVRGLDRACREVARRAGEVAAAEIKRLEEALKASEAEVAEYRKRDDQRRNRHAYVEDGAPF